MLRLLGLLSLAASISLASGCAMCCHPFDCHYQYQGGRWVRDIPDRGRVGSAFDEAGHRVDDDTAPAQAQAVPTPAEPLPVPSVNGDTNSRLMPQRPQRGATEPYLPME